MFRCWVRELWHFHIGVAGRESGGQRISGYYVTRNRLPHTPNTMPSPGMANWCRSFPLHRIPWLTHASHTHKRTRKAKYRWLETWLSAGDAFIASNLWILVTVQCLVGWLVGCCCCSRHEYPPLIVRFQIGLPLISFASCTHREWEPHRGAHKA